MVRELAAHPDSPCRWVKLLAADAQRSGGELRLRFVLDAELARLKIPPAGKAVRADELWRHTCFEAFVQPTREAGYWEFNFSPSGAWAAYRFEGYREGMAPAQVATPRMELSTERGLIFTATVEVPAAEADWDVGLSAVIEDADGERSYWAIRHGAGKPDFHHADCFALFLPARG